MPRVNRLERPLLVFDGDCGFCRAWVARWHRAAGERFDVAPYQAVADRFADVVPREHFAAAVHLIEPGGRVSRGAEAVFRALALAPGGGAWLALYQRVPGFAALMEWKYRVVATHRRFFTWLSRAIWGEHVVPPGTAFTSALFLRAIGLTYLVAFVSLGSQVVGLVGHDGVLPTEEFLRAVAAQTGAIRYYVLPTLCWLNASDASLLAQCAAGVACGLLALLGIAPALTLALAWLLYLSLATVCRDFLWFQWDSLLLEVGVLAVLAAPLVWRAPLRGGAEPPRLARWLPRWLLLRLMLSSAAVKLTSHDPTWRTLTALRYHYETQPLPPWTAWYFHHLPAWFQTWSAAFMFAVEGVAPLFLFAPRRVRFAAAAAIASLQVLIVITGNYGFFNLLALALCLTVLDDGVWPARWRVMRAAEASPRRAAHWPRWVLAPAAAVLFTLSLVPTFGAFAWPVRWLEPLGTAFSLVSPLRIVDNYGLFAVMTTTRPEIVIEGSRDGVTWQAYEFRWKPGTLTRRPEFMAPHMPRLDWQMWFAALSDFRREPWFLSLCRAILLGRQPVLALLAHDPYAGQPPPRFLRATVYDYHFTSAAARRASGEWWTRTPRGLYCPILTLVDGQLTPVESIGGR